MTEDEELELLRLQKAKAMAGGGAAIPAPSLIGQRGTDIFGRELGDGTGVGRDTAASGLFGPSKALGGLIDLLQAGHHNLKKQKQREQGGPAPEPPESITERVNALRDEAAGRPVGNSIPAAAAEGATGSLMFPGGAAANAASGAVGAATTQAATNAGASPAKAGLLGLLTGGVTGLGTAVPGFVAKKLAGGRAEEALRGMNQDDITAAIRLQKESPVPLFPSQASPGAAPGLQQLETEILRSKSKGAMPAQQMGFKQAPISSAFADSLLNRILPTKAGASSDDLASGLASAAGARSAADIEALNARTAHLYKTAKETKGVVAGEDLQAIFDRLKAELADRSLPQQARRDFTEFQKKLVLESAANKGSIPAPVMRALYQSLEDKITALKAPGLPEYPDYVAGRVRKVLDSTVREAYENAEPLYRVARELQSSGRQNATRGQFDQLTQLANAGGDSEAFLRNLPAKGEGLREISSGVPIKLDKGEYGRQGANPEAVRDALAAGLRLQKNKAFELSQAGEMMQNSPAVLVNALAGTPEKSKSLITGLRAAGVPEEKIAELEKGLQVLQAAGRPTVVHGSRVPVTGIDPVDVARATIGGSLQQQQARMSMLRSTVNMMTDKEVAAVLAQPNSLELLQKMPGAKALDPRAALVGVLMAQSQLTDSTQ